MGSLPVVRMKTLPAGNTAYPMPRSRSCESLRYRQSMLRYVRSSKGVAIASARSSKKSWVMLASIAGSHESMSANVRSGSRVRTASPSRLPVLPRYKNTMRFWSNRSVSEEGGAMRHSAKKSARVAGYSWGPSWSSTMTRLTVPSRSSSFHESSMRRRNWPRSCFFIVMVRLDSVAKSACGAPRGIARGFAVPARGVAVRAAPRLRYHHAPPPTRSKTSAAPAIPTAGILLRAGEASPARAGTSACVPIICISVGLWFLNSPSTSERMVRMAGRRVSCGLCGVGFCFCSGGIVDMFS